MKRVDKAGRDVTDLPGLWNQSDRHQITEPMIINAGDPIPSFIEVVEPFDGPAITIRGDGSPNGIGARVPEFTLECNWMSAGVVYDRIDNGIIKPAKINRSSGEGVTISSCRQCLFEGLQVNECTMALSAMEIKCYREWQGDSTNACTFNFVSIYACNTQHLLSIRGNTVRGLGTCRNNKFVSVFLHPTWKRQLEALDDNPRIYMFGQNDIKHMLWLSNVEDVGIDRLTVTAPEGSQVLGMANRCDRVSIAGRALVFNAGQVIQIPGVDTSRLAVVVRR